MENVERNNEAIKKSASQSSSCKIDVPKNPDQPIAMIMIKLDKYSLNSFVPGYQIYMDI